MAETNVEEKFKFGKDLGWKILKGTVRALGAVGAGIIVGAGLAGIDLGPIKGPAKIMTGLGIVGLADACAEVAGNRLEKRVDDARECFEFGEGVAEHLDEIKERKEKEKAEAEKAKA